MMRWGFVLGFALAGCGGIVDDRPPASLAPDAQDAGPSDPILDRYVRAVCACGDGWAGCDANVRGESRFANRPCLERYAELYEHACNGRLPDGGSTLGCSL
jgi:hypothetical protein